MKIHTMNTYDQMNEQCVVYRKNKWWVRGMDWTNHHECSESYEEPYSTDEDP